MILDLFAEDDWRSVYAGELEVRPPGAPTTGPDTEKRGRWIWLSQSVAGVVDALPFHPGERPAVGQAVAVLLAAYCGYMGTTRMRWQFCSLSLRSTPGMEGLP